MLVRISLCEERVGEMGAGVCCGLSGKTKCRLHPALFHFLFFFFFLQTICVDRNHFGVKRDSGDNSGRGRWPVTLHRHRLVGQVVKASASRAGGPGFESR